MNNIQKLTILQKELGYHQGDLNPVAILGIAGEAAEVIEEVNIAFGGPNAAQSQIEDLSDFIDAGNNLDHHKKQVRKNKLECAVNCDDMGRLDLEMSDLLYYVNIYCLNRGFTIEHLAGLSHDKVRSKMASGGSSEQRS